MKREMSAKDKAFEKERTKFRQEIRDIKRQSSIALNNKQQEIDSLTESLKEKDAVIAKQQEYISNLLECTKLSKEQLDTLIESGKIREELSKHILALGNINKLLSIY